MRYAILAAAAVALLAVSPALAQTEPTPPPASEQQPDGTTTEPEATQPAEEEQSADQRVICRTVQRTESRLRSRRERICGTRAQWEQMQEQAARDTQRVGSVPAPGNN